MNDLFNASPEEDNPQDQAESGHRPGRARAWEFRKGAGHFSAGTVLNSGSGLRKKTRSWRNQSVKKPAAKAANNMTSNRLILTWRSNACRRLTLVPSVMASPGVGPEPSKSSRVFARR